MPTRRFNYKSFTSVSIEDAYINRNSTFIQTAINLENINLPITTTFNNVQLGNVATKNTTDTIIDNDEVIPLNSTIFNMYNSLIDEYLPYIQKYETPEFMVILPSYQIFVGDIFRGEIYAISTGPIDKYLKSITLKMLVYKSQNSEEITQIEFVDFSNSNFYTLELINIENETIRSIITFKITENFPNIGLKKSYTDLHLGTINFRINGTIDAYGNFFYKRQLYVLGQVQILELLDGNNINYLSSVQDEHINIINFESELAKIANIKSCNGRLVPNNVSQGGSISIGRPIKVAI